MLKGHTAVGRFDKFIGEAKAESEARVKAKDEEQRVQRAEEDARHLRDQSIFELHILPIIRDAENSCRAAGICSTLKTSWDANGVSENKWVNFELHGPQLDNLPEEVCDPRSAALNIELANGEVNFRIGRGQDSHYNKHSLNTASVQDGAAIETLAERSIQTIIKSYFLATEKRGK